MCLYCQTLREEVGEEECDCSYGSGSRRVERSCTYTCYLLYGTVDYGGGQKAYNVSFYDKEANLNGKVNENISMKLVSWSNGWLTEIEY